MENMICIFNVNFFEMPCEKKERDETRRGGRTQCLKILANSSYDFGSDGIFMLSVDDP